MRITYDWPQVFVLQGSPKTLFGFLTISYREAGKEQGATGGFLKVDGEVTKLTVDSLDDEVLSITQDERFAKTNYVFRFSKGGIVGVKVTIGDRRVLIPLRVTELPVRKGTSVEEVIEKLGLPKKKEMVYCGWPDSKTEDSIFYNAEAGQTIAAQHWEIEEHDVCILSMVDGNVYDVGLDDSMLRLRHADLMAWMKGKLDDIVKNAPVKRPLKPGTKRAATSSPYVVRTWTDATGKFSVKAKFIEFKNSQVHLERREDGKKINLPMARLSKEDQKWIRDELRRRFEEKRAAAKKGRR